MDLVSVCIDFHVLILSFGTAVGINPDKVLFTLVPDLHFQTSHIPPILMKFQSCCSFFVLYDGIHRLSSRYIRDRHTIPGTILIDKVFPVDIGIRIHTTITVKIVPGALDLLPAGRHIPRFFQEVPYILI